MSFTWWFRKIRLRLDETTAKMKEDVAVLVKRYRRQWKVFLFAMDFGQYIFKP